jgi:parallel beta-helix repeat protein
MISSISVGENEMRRSFQPLSILLILTVLIIGFSFVCKAEQSSLTLQSYVAVGESIQEAINNATDGDIIVIQDGIHVEQSYPIFVNKTVTLIGQDVRQTVIDGNGSKVGIFLANATNARFLNLTIQNTTNDWFASGITISNTAKVEISECMITSCGSGILFSNAVNNSIIRNNIYNNKGYGIYIHAYSSLNNLIGNNITNNPTGIFTDLNCQNNLVYYNNFVNNSFQQSGFGSNYWNGAYPVGGNYWSDHTNIDLMNGIYQNISGSDGIADSGYPALQELDGYPLAKPIYFFYMYTWNQQDYYFATVTNSTISNLQFDPAQGNFVRFNAAGDSGDVGCCRAVIPKEMLWVDNPAQWTVVSNETAITNLLTTEDSTNTYLYFTYYYQSTQTIKITGTHAISEYSQFFLIPALLLALCTVCLLARKHAYRKTAS